MKKLVLLLIGFFFTQNLIYSDSSETILKIGDYEFSDTEFWHVYNKNKNLPNFTETPEEFSERFIAYKLKVIEAVSQGFDTLTSFKSEYDSYTSELKKSFLIDSTALEKVIDEAVENMNWMVDASHILIAVNKNATPSDTLEAWNKITKIKTEIEEGKPFSEAALEYSNDPSVTKNKGRLGYFTAFQMVYPFEKVAFSSAVNQVSEIARSDFGYHLVWVHDKVEHPGEIKVAHIMKMFTRSMGRIQKAKCKAEIDSLYEMLKKGEDFYELVAKHSGDLHSAKNGGQMQPFSLNNMIPEFAKASFALEKDGDISEPVLTSFGWHIIKRLELIPNRDPKTRIAEIKHLLGRDGRDKAGQKAYLQGCIKSENFQLNEELKNEILSSVTDENIIIDDVKSILANKLNEVAFSYRGDEFLLSDFFEWISDDNKEINRVQLTEKFEKYIELRVQEIEMRDLAENNEQYKFLSNEYFDGLLIFDISEKEIWSQVDKDSAALANFHLSNKEKFMSVPKLEGDIYIVHDEKFANKISKKQSKKADLDVFTFIASKDKKFKKSKMESGFFDFIENASNPIKSSDLPNSHLYSDYNSIVYWRGEIVPSALIPLENIKGEVISAYQIQKEHLWVESLKEKFKPIFNYELLSK